MPDKSVSDETESEGEGGHSRKVENRVSKLEKEVGALGRDFDFVQEQLGELLNVMRGIADDPNLTEPTRNHIADVLRRLHRFQRPKSIEGS